MKKFNLLTLLCAILLAGVMQSCNQAPVIEGENYSFKDGMIVFDEPARAAGQESMLGFAAEPIPVVRVGFVGIGMVALLFIFNRSSLLLPWTLR